MADIVISLDEIACGATAQVIGSGVGTVKSSAEELGEKGKAAEAASKKLAFLSTEVKNKALLNIAEALIDRKDDVLAANKIDYDESRASGISAKGTIRKRAIFLRIVVSLLWKAETKCRASFQFALHPNPAAVALDDMLYDREP